MDADIDADIAHTPESIFIFPAAIYTAIFNICTIFADRLLYLYLRQVPYLLQWIQKITKIGVKRNFCVMKACVLLDQTVGHIKQHMPCATRNTRFRLTRRTSEPRPDVHGQGEKQLTEPRFCWSN